MPKGSAYSSPVGGKGSAPPAPARMTGKAPGMPMGGSKIPKSNGTFGSMICKKSSKKPC